MAKRTAKRQADQMPWSGSIGLWVHRDFEPELTGILGFLQLLEELNGDVAFSSKPPPHCLNYDLHC